MPQMLPRIKENNLPSKGQRSTPEETPMPMVHRQAPTSRKPVPLDGEE